MTHIELDRNGRAEGERLELLLPRRDPALRRTHRERQRDQLLLSPIVEVALDAAAGVVPGSDNARAGGDQLATHRRVRHRRRNELGKAGEPLLRTGRGRLFPPAPGDPESPKAPPY